jgi:hypothetical protein
MGARLFRALPSLRVVAVVLILAGTAIIACDVGSLTTAVVGSKPTVSIQSPVSGTIFREGDEVEVQSTAKDQVGIVRVELAVDGTAFRTDAPPVPQGQTFFSIVQKWPAVSGTHTLSVRAFNASGAASDLALVTVSVAASTAKAQVSPTSAGSFLELETPTAGPLPPPFPVTSTVTNTVGSSVPAARPSVQVAPTPSFSAPPGVYATLIRVDPATPKRGVPPTFHITFVNTTGKPQSYRWYVKVYEPDKANSKGETSKLLEDIPPGTSERASPADWKISGPGPCEPFIARVFWFDRENNATTEFIKPDKSGGPAAGFQVCP